jgi:hypothetical protein
VEEQRHHIGLDCAMAVIVPPLPASSGQSLLTCGA